MARGVDSRYGVLGAITQLHYIVYHIKDARTHSRCLEGGLCVHRARFAIGCVAKLGCLFVVVFTRFVLFVLVCLFLVVCCILLVLAI